MENDIKKLLEGHQGKIEERIYDFKEEIKGHIGVLVEDSDKKIAVIAEQHLSIMKILGQHTEDIGTITEEIGTIKEEIVGMNIKLGHIEDQLRRKVDYEEFEKLEKQVVILEASKR